MRMILARLMASGSIVTATCGVAGEAVVRWNPEPTEINGRKVYQLKGKVRGSRRGDGIQSPGQGHVAFIKLPERCANLCFGGPKRNRLYMAASHSLYAFSVEAYGAI